MRRRAPLHRRRQPLYVLLCVRNVLFSSKVESRPETRLSLQVSDTRWTQRVWVLGFAAKQSAVFDFHMVSFH